MVDFSRAIVALGIDVVTFNFLYTEQRRQPPDHAPVLEACYRAAIGAPRREVASARRALFIGGKSMGGRIATQVAAADAALSLTGLVLLGYPLHPPGRPDQRRDRAPAGGQTPDALRPGQPRHFRYAGGADADARRTRSHPSAIHIVEDGDHSFKVSRAGPAEQAAVYEQIQQTIATWIRDRVSERDR